MIVFGITGSLGSGKSTVAQHFINAWPQKNLKIIELDDLRRHALWVSNEPRHILLRQQLANRFKIETREKELWIDRKLFTSLIFKHIENLELYSEIATPVLMDDTKRLIKEDSMDKVVVWSHLIEEKYYNLLNSPVVIINCDNNHILDRLIESHDTNEILNLNDVCQRIEISLSSQQKMLLCKQLNVPFIEFDNNNFTLQNLQIAINKIKPND